jgi:general secretion pathway protein H
MPRPAPTNRSGARRNRGVSLLELVVVISLIAIASAMAAGLMASGLPGQQLRGASRELAAQLRFARAQAIVTGQAQRFELDATTREWRGPKRRQGALPKKIEVIALGARDEQAEAGVAVYRFFPDGSSTGGNIRLRRGTAQWRLDIDWLTGAVTVRRGGDDR